MPKRVVKEVEQFTQGERFTVAGFLATAIVLFMLYRHVKRAKLAASIGVSASDSGIDVSGNVGLQGLGNNLPQSAYGATINGAQAYVRQAPQFMGPMV